MNNELNFIFIGKLYSLKYARALQYTYSWDNYCLFIKKVYIRLFFSWGKHSRILITMSFARVIKSLAINAKRFLGNKIFLINLVFVILSNRKRNFPTVKASLKYNMKRQFFSNVHVIKLS